MSSQIQPESIQIENKPKDIKQIRLNKELKILDQKFKEENKKHLKYQHFPKKYKIVLNKFIVIEYGPEFPFSKPKI